MTTVRVLLSLKQDRSNTSNSFLFENSFTEEGFMLRAPRGRLPDDIEFVSVEMTVDASGATGQFVLFLREAVRLAPDGRLSGNKIWEAWAERNGESSSLPLIAGIDRRDIHRQFRFAFDEDKMSWRRLDGEPQWLWMGYELVSKGGDSAKGGV